MKKYLKWMLMGLTMTMGWTGCTDDTGTLGIADDMDHISSSITHYPVTTRSIPTGSVKADNTNACLGKVIDPETGSTIEADCAAQFYCLEDYQLPDKDLMVGDITLDPETGDTTDIEYGVPKCDSCELRIYIKDYYGDANNPMKLEVYELSDEVIMEEGETYHTDIDLSQYIKEGAGPIASKVFTTEDYIVSEGDRNNSSYNKNIRVVLPASFGQKILEKGYANPDALKTSYRFIREIFPGFYLRISNGEGTMLTVLVSTVNLYFNYCDKEDKKEINQGVTRFAATPEVIQSTRFTNGNIDKLLQETGYTYLKTPAGICTEMTLPINEIFNEHPNDSVSLAEVTLQRYNKDQDAYQLGTPGNLLLVRKGQMEEFFAKKSVNDNKTSFITTFDSSHNTYTFTNIARLLSYCWHEKKTAAEKEGITEAAWEAQHPDWNKVVLIPVTVSSNSSGYTTSVNHDMGMNSAKLIGGDTPLKMQVVYSKFK